jgi:Winged helix-turn helix
MFARVAALAVAPDQLEQLESLARSGLTPQRVARKCRVVLLASQGMANHAIAQQTGLSRPTVIATRHAFARAGIEGIRLPQNRKKPSPILTPELKQKILDSTLKTKPPGETPLECAQASPPSRHFAHHGASRVARLGHPAASSGEI